MWTPARAKDLQQAARWHRRMIRAAFLSMLGVVGLFGGLVLAPVPNGNDAPSWPPALFVAIMILCAISAISGLYALLCTVPLGKALGLGFFGRNGPFLITRLDSQTRRAMRRLIFRSVRWAFRVGTCRAFRNSRTANAATTILQHPLVHRARSAVCHHSLGARGCTTRRWPRWESR